MVSEERFTKAIQDLNKDADSDPGWQDQVHRRIAAGETFSARPWWQERICLLAAGLAVWSVFATASTMWLWHAVDLQQRRAAACEARRP